ncbi:MAG: response regulator [Phycisphaerales bacterium]
MKRDIPILIAEDDSLDVKNIKRSFADNRVLNPLYFVGNGEEALAFLRGEPPYDGPARAPQPGLILLDLNMPRLSGLEFLSLYKADPALRHIPAVILTTSDEETDLARSYEIGIAGYIVKPIEFASLVDVIRTFDLYWSICEIANEQRARKG